MFYCKAGKDRTGIVAALLLSLAGATDDQIISDYILCAATRLCLLKGIALCIDGMWS